MLPRQHRMTDSTDFSTTVRSGRKTKSGRMIAYLLPVELDSQVDVPGTPARLGLIVNTRVGNSVQRHRVSRVIRHQVRPHIGDLDPGSGLVFRALPGAGSRTNAAIAADVNSCLSVLVGS